VDEQRALALAFGPVGLAGWALLVLGILTRSRLLSFAGLGAVAADVTVAEFAGFKAMSEARSAAGPPRGPPANRLVGSPSRRR
jgi:hypothetical protein